MVTVTQPHTVWFMVTVTQPRTDSFQQYDFVLTNDVGS